MCKSGGTVAHWFYNFRKYEQLYKKIPFTVNKTIEAVINPLELLLTPL